MRRFLSLSSPHVRWGWIVCAAILGGGFTACKREKAALAPAEKSSGAIRIMAQIVHKSPVPDPKKSDYEDCLYTAEVKVADDPAHSVPDELVLVLPAFMKRVLQPEAAFKEGQWVEAEVVPHEKAAERFKVMQRSDTLERFELPVYDALSVRASSKTGVFASANPASPPTQPPAGALSATAPEHYPWSAKAASERSAAIARDKAVILQAFARHGSDWNKWDHELDAFYDDLEAQVNASPNGELLKGVSEFRHLPLRKYKGLCEDSTAGEPGPLKMFQSLNQQLRARALTFIVVPFPIKEDIYSELFSKAAPADGIFEPYREQFLLQLLDADIEVIDLVQPLRAARSRFPYIFYDHDDDHPADGAIQVAAEEIAKRLSRYDLAPPGVKPPGWHLQPVQVEKKTERGIRHYPATRVATADGNPLVVPENSGSPVIIMGDSYTRIPHQYLPGGDGCSIPMHLAYRLGVVPDNLIQMGGSGQGLRMLAREGRKYLAHRCALVFVFAHTRLFGAVAKNHGSGEWDLVNLPPLSLDQ